MKGLRQGALAFMVSAEYETITMLPSSFCRIQRMVAHDSLIALFAPHGARLGPAATHTWPRGQPSSNPDRGRHKNGKTHARGKARARAREGAHTRTYACVRAARTRDRARARAREEATARRKKSAHADEVDCARARTRSKARTCTFA